MTVTECAKRLGKTVKFVSLGLQQGKFPWGVAVESGRNARGKTYDYYINEVALEKWLVGEITVIELRGTNYDFH